MRIIGKPVNQWGWIRAAGWILAAGVLGWAVLAAVLRAAGDIPWMAWSGYQSFSIVDGIELLALPLLAVFVGGWLEEQNLQTETERSHSREVEQAAAGQRKRIIQHVHDAVLSSLANEETAGGQIPLADRSMLAGVIRAALSELDGKGRGDLLHFLFEKGLFAGEKPALELQGMDLRAVTISHARLSGIYLENSDLSAARLDGAHLAKSRLSASLLTKAFLRDADLREAVLAGADLSGAHLEGARLEGADLTGAWLQRAIFTNANLSRCILNGSQVTDAIFYRVDLRGSRIDSPQQLDQAILIETILPDGRKVTNEKGKSYLESREIATLIDRL